MAKIEYIHSQDSDDNDLSSASEIIEVRVWGLGGTDSQQFYIGSGFNFAAGGNIWLEIIYSIGNAQVFYTRTFLHHNSSPDDIQTSEDYLDGIIKAGEGRFGFGDMLPETHLILTVEKSSYPDEDGQEKEYSNCKLTLSADTGAVLGMSPPGQRSVDIILDSIELEDGGRFMRELLHEIHAAQLGRHPNPAAYPTGSSEWPFVVQLNRQAYNQLSTSYRESYFANPLLDQAFDGWLAELPAGSHILDAGCGHGDPVITRLLERGFQVTGSDFSPEMLRRAGQQFPQVNLIPQAITALTEQAQFDGVCSFSSMLYLDPIDFLNSIHRLHSALKPGGILFLYAYDSAPGWRGLPFQPVMNQWMWTWHYGMEEAACLLEEHGYFEVLERRKVKVDENEEQRITQELEKLKQAQEEYRQKQAENPDEFPFFMPFFPTPIERSPYAYAITARRRA